MTVCITPQRQKMLIDKLKTLNERLVGERKELAEARGDDHEPSVNATLQDVAERISNTEREISDIIDVLHSATLVEPCEGCVGLGSKVLLELNGPKTHDRLLALIDGYADARHEIPILTPDAPMIQRIMGLKETEEASFVFPSGEKVVVKVVEVGTYC